MGHDQSRLVLAFAGLSHGLFHVMAGLFLTLVLVIEPVWQLPYARLIELWTVGALLMGLAAPMAGWLGDRLGETRLMIVFLLGMGAAGILCGLADGPQRLQLALAALGFFGGIYHPVGTAWVVKNARQRGRAIALVGICGSIGIALASLIAGGLADVAGWRAAFIVPGAVMIAAGLALLGTYLSGAIVDRSSDLTPAPEPTAIDVRRALWVMVITMTLTSIAYYAFSTMLPKWIEREIGASLGSGLTRVGALVTVIYLSGVIGQWIAGGLADRGYAREAYAASFVLNFLAMLAASQMGGWPIVIAAIAVVMVLDHAASIENMLIARYTPSARRGLAYGLRNGISIAAGPLGVQMVARLFDPATGFQPLLQVLAAMAAVIVAIAMQLPRDQHRARERTAPAE